MLLDHLALQAQGRHAPAHLPVRTRQHGTGLCDAPPVRCGAVDAGVLEHLPGSLAAAERWLRELGPDRASAEARARPSPPRGRARDSSAASPLGDRYDRQDDLDSPRRVDAP